MEKALNIFEGVKKWKEMITGLSVMVITRTERKKFINHSPPGHRRIGMPESIITKPSKNIFVGLMSLLKGAKNEREMGKNLYGIGRCL